MNGYWSPPWHAHSISPARAPAARPARGCAIAIVGLNGRYPKSRTHYEFWRRVYRGENLIGEIPSSRFDASRAFDPSHRREIRAGVITNRYGAFIDDYDSFDAEFFGVRAQEVDYMDPQGRIALETTWGCIEDAGHTPSTLGETVGVFGGIAYAEHQKRLPFSSYASLLTNRISHFFDFTGPAITVNAGSCSSLVAIDGACRALDGRQCDAAIVFGCNLVLLRDHYVALSGVLSSSDRPISIPFGTDDGWIPGEGVVSIALKRLDDAQRDGDHVYAVIRSTCISHTGRAAWFGAFDPARQTDMLLESFRLAGVHPETIGHFEPMANGYTVGDAIEYEAICRAFSTFSRRRNFCAIGSVKANAGHGEGASTLIQLTKVIQQLQMGVHIPTINIDAASHKFQTDGSALYLPVELGPWTPPEVVIDGARFSLPRRASISSFGGGGNLGNMILEEAPARPADEAFPGPYFIPLSAQSEGQLTQAATDLRAFLDDDSRYLQSPRYEERLSSLMFTLCVGRAQFPQRAVCLVDDFAALLNALDSLVRGVEDRSVVRAQPAPSRAAEPTILDAGQFFASHDGIALAHAWVGGAQIDWTHMFQGKSLRRTPLPTYNFRRSRFPVSPTAGD